MVYYARMTQKPGCGFSLSVVAATAFRKFRDDRRIVRPGISYSQALELLLAHWEEKPAGFRWVKFFEFKTKRGWTRGKKRKESLTPEP